MAKIVLIGAGSQFGDQLSIDILSRPALADSEICLCDLNARRLNQIYRYVQATVDHYHLPTRVRASTDRRELLKDADFVVTSIATGGGAMCGHPYNDEVEIPRKYGIDQRVADSMSVGAIFRFLRTAPVQLQILRDVEELAPNALLLNHTNPMSAISCVHATMSSLKSVGLCHGIIHTNNAVSRYLHLDPTHARYTVAGINHLAWFLSWENDGKDVYTLLRERLADKNDPETQQFLIDESVRTELFQTFGYFPTESNRHDSEYLPYFRRTRELREYYHLPERVLTEAPTESRIWMAEEEQLHGKLGFSDEYTTCIMEAVVTDKPFRFNGNVQNTGLITNLPQDLTVEVPCMADCHGIRPIYVGELPPQLAALNAPQMYVQRLLVQAVREHDKESALHAVLLDPNAAAVLSIPKIKEMFAEMWEVEKEHLAWYEPGFSGKVPEIYAP